MESLNDPAFGELVDRDEVGNWYRWYEISIFGERKRVKLVVTYAKMPTEAQQSTFMKFEQHKHECIENIEKSIWNYYISELEDRRDDLGDDADEMMPVISSINELKEMLTLEQIIVPPRNKEIGFLFECTWEDDHGLGVKLRDNEVKGVGFQDIVL